MTCSPAAPHSQTAAPLPLPDSSRSVCGPGGGYAYAPPKNFCTHKKCGESVRKNTATNQSFFKNLGLLIQAFPLAPAQSLVRGAVKGSGSPALQWINPELSHKFSQAPYIYRKCRKEVAASEKVTSGLKTLCARFKAWQGTPDLARGLHQGPESKRLLVTPQQRLRSRLTCQTQPAGRTEEASILCLNPLYPCRDFTDRAGHRTPFILLDAKPPQRRGSAPYQLPCPALSFKHSAWVPSPSCREPGSCRGRGSGQALGAPPHHHAMRSLSNSSLPITIQHIPIATAP